MRFTNDGASSVVFPTLEPPVELQPGESIDLPDPEPAAPAFDPAGRHTIAEVMAWVIDAPDAATAASRAAEALAAEEASPEARSTLISQLAELIPTEA